MIIRIAGCYSRLFAVGFLLLWPLCVFGQETDDGYPSVGLMHSLIPDFDYDDFGGIHNPGDKPIELRVSTGEGERQVIRLKPGEILKIEIASSDEPIPAFAVIDEKEPPNPWAKQWWYVSDDDWDGKFRLRPGFSLEWYTDLAEKIRSEVKAFGFEPKTDNDRSHKAYGTNVLIFEIARNVIEREVRAKYPNEHFESFPLRFDYGRFFDYFLIGEVVEKEAAEITIADGGSIPENGDDIGPAVLNKTSAPEGYALVYMSKLSPEFQIFLSVVLEMVFESELLVFDYHPVGSRSSYSLDGEKLFLIDLDRKYYSLENRITIADEEKISAGIVSIFESLGIKDVKKEVIGKHSGHPKLRYTSKKWKVEGKIPGLEDKELELGLSIRLDIDFQTFLINEESDDENDEKFDASLGVVYKLLTLLEVKIPGLDGKQIILENEEHDPVPFILGNISPDEKFVENGKFQITQKDAIKFDDPELHPLLRALELRLRKELSGIGNRE